LRTVGDLQSLSASKMTKLQEPVVGPNDNKLAKIMLNFENSNH